MTTVSDMEEKTVLVTGSRQGIGRFIAEHFLQRGCQVVGFSRGPASIEDPRYTHYCVDVGDPTAVDAAFQAVAKDVGRVDILVNNAGVASSIYAMVMPPASARAMIDTNLFGTFLVSRNAAKMMRKRKWGRIINIGSMMTAIEPVGGSIYAATKAATAALANVLAKELGPWGITCNTLAVTAIETDMLDQLSEELVRDIVGRLPVPRLANMHDITNVLDFFVSERSDYITAQTIWLGGVH